MKNVLKTTTRICQSCGRYYFREYMTRPPVLCLECADYRKREGNKARQRDYRQRQREAKAKNAKQPGATVSRPVRLGRPAVVAGRGLYANEPEPERTTKRRKVGLGNAA